MARGVDLFRRPFWRNHAAWRRGACRRMSSGWALATTLSVWASHLAGQRRLGGTDRPRDRGRALLRDYVAAFRDDAPPLGRAGTPSDARRIAAALSGPLSGPGPLPGSPEPAGVLRVFRDAGVGGRAHATPTIQLQDIALIFRSSPYGAVSHSHASNNDFIVHVAGKAMAMPSGYYAGYGSAHHAHWVWHTQSHNCVTLSGASQLLRSHDSAGRDRARLRG